MLQRNEVMKNSALGMLAVLLAASWVGAVSVPFRIQMESWSPYFAPVTATVTAGNPIRWENPTGSHHTITHDGCRGSGACAFDSGSIGPDGVFELAQLPPGQYPYHCMLCCIRSCVGRWSLWMRRIPRKSNPRRSQNPPMPFKGSPQIVYGKNPVQDS